MNGWAAFPDERQGVGFIIPPKEGHTSPKAGAKSNEK